MKNKYLILAAALLLLACKKDEPVIPGPVPEPDPEGTVYFTESEEQIANPERGFYVQKYYTTEDLEDTVTIATITNQRDLSHITLFLHSYYLTDYIESDIAPAFLERLERNMNALRAGGAKVILRFSYKSNHNNNDKPWDATPQWANKHIDQIAPYLMKHADVIYCIQCGFIGSWGEWYYTDNYPFNPYDDDEFEPYFEIADHLMNVTPKDRQICFRQPQFKMRYLKMHKMEVAPLNPSEAYQQTVKARWAGHNDCFVSSPSDKGTYHNDEERAFWAEDTKYTLMGGETCEECEYSVGENAIKEMEKYHWSYICNSYHPAILGSWVTDGYYEEIKRRIGYRFVLDKAYLTQQPTAGNTFEAKITLHNAGFAAPANKRELEMIFVSVTDPDKKFVYKQTEDPRFWMAGEKRVVNLSCKLDAGMKGEYKLYLNLPDPYASLHDDPRYSIRLANKDCWDEKTGYNYLTTVAVE